MPLKNGSAPRCEPERKAALPSNVTFTGTPSAVIASVSTLA
jgi:hypothetical protein